LAKFHYDSSKVVMLIFKGLISTVCRFEFPVT